VDITKTDLELMSNLVFDSCITQELEFSGVHFLFSTLSTEVRRAIETKFRYKSNKQNISLVVKILANSIIAIDGEEVAKDELEFSLWRLNSKIILKFYEFYRQLDEKVSSISKYIDYYLETKESRSNWTVFKVCSRSNDLFFIRKLNQYQYYWIVMNVFKDQIEEEKRQWSRTEYMTNSICAYVNPKAYRKSKGEKSITDQFEQYEDKQKKDIVDKIEKGEKIVEVQQENQQQVHTAFTSWTKMSNETEEQHAARLEEMMKVSLSGEDSDNFDKIIREECMNSLYKNLIDRRKKILIEKEAFKKRNLSTDVFENEQTKKEDEELKKKGYYCEGISYLEIINRKEYMILSKKYKLQTFEKAMTEKLDIEKDVENFLKSLSKLPNIIEDDVEHQNDLDVGETKEPAVIGASHNEADSSNKAQSIYRNAAERAASMKIHVEPVNLLDQKKEKNNRISDALEARKNMKSFEKKDISEEDESLDVMRFD